MNVLDAARARIDRMLDDFEYLYVSFSGGKDSGVLLNLALERARLRGRRIGVFHIDYEAQYQATTDYVDATLAALAPVADIWRICLPLTVPCATSMHQAHWTPWNPGERVIWVREMPSDAVSVNNAPGCFQPGMWDYDFQEEFGGWLRGHLGVKSVACLVGIRSQESLNRWRAIWRGDRVNMHAGLKWTRSIEPGVCNAYPIHDWLVEDIWTANASFGWAYNRLYDLFYQAGVTLNAMRVASPFISQGADSLKLYRAIEPHTWGKLVSRVNGVNFTGIYGGTTAMGWRSITKPPGHTWKSYMDFLLSTLPADTAASYRAKLATSLHFWAERGGVLSDTTLQQIEATGARFTTHETTSYKTSKKTVRFEDYPDDLDIDEFNLAPSYKRMCVCIMKNDHTCKYMGFAQTRIEQDRRAAALKKYQGL